MKTVFTNGCFDILHPGHIDLLQRAKKLGDRLIVAINSDASVSQIKGSGRPIVDQASRKAVLLGLRSVDEVHIFNELTPERIIKQIKPDVLVKGGDWRADEIIGADFVVGNGGKVVSLPLLSGYSSTRVLERILGKRERDEMLDEHGSGMIETSISEHIEVFNLLSDGSINAIGNCAEIILETFRSDNRIVICSNDTGSASAHYCASILGEWYNNGTRRLPAIIIKADGSTPSMIGDREAALYSQVESFPSSGDCLVVISSNRESDNLIGTVMDARRNNCKIVALVGPEGKKIASLSHAAIMIPSLHIRRIQEAHIAIIHVWSEYFQRNSSEANEPIK